MNFKITSISLSISKAVIVLLLFSVQNIFSQDISGIVLDEENKPIEFASVALLQPKDSLLVKYTSTDRNGKYVLPNIKAGTYLFQIYLMTYQANQQTITVEGSDMNIKTVSLKRSLSSGFAFLTVI